MGGKQVKRRLCRAPGRCGGVDAELALAEKAEAADFPGPLQSPPPLGSHR